MHAVFLGTTTHPVDSDFRTRIPERFKNNLGDPFVITRGLGCVYLMPVEVYEAEAKPLLDMKGTLAAMTDPKLAMLKHYMFSGAAYISADKQSRVTLSPELRKHAGIEKEVVIAGSGDRIEVWDPGRWEALQPDLSTDKVDQARLALESRGAASGEALPPAGPAEANG